MSQSPVIVQDCGCIALPEDVAASLGMTPGAELTLAVDPAKRSITLTALEVSGPVQTVPLAACPIRP
ncbi:MAG TPA: hypothetical protein VGN16_17715 [Acidobacteriaceae bacterium]